MTALYKEFGRTGVRVCALGFGANRPPVKKGGIESMPDPLRVDEERQIELFKIALKLGVNYFDTCEFYRRGQSEAILGKFVKDAERSKIILSSKIPVEPSMSGCGERGKEWRLRLDGQLKRLQTDYIDFHHFHDLRWDNFKDYLTLPGGPLKAAKKARKEGAIRHISFSSHDTPANIIRLINTGEFESILVYYNLLYRLNEDAMRKAHEKGIGVAVMGPSCGGQLVFKHNLNAKQKKIRAWFVYRFVFANPNIDLVLSGLSTQPMIKEDLNIAQNRTPLTSQERRSVESIYQEVKGLKDIFCLGCGYCLPCAQGVDIPTILFLFNVIMIFREMRAWAKGQYLKLFSEKKAANRCSGCGKCLKKCPQSLDIPRILKHNHNKVFREAIK